MDKDIKAHIEYLLCIKIEQVQSVSGGDISNAYLLKTESERFFCKVNTDPSAFDMFWTEKSGLEAIAETKTIATPKVLLCEKLETGGFLLMEHIESKRASSTETELLGHQLAALHQLSISESFGWETDNFIGSLPQSNKKHSDWKQFYTQERLLTQLKMAHDSGKLNAHEIPSEEGIFKSCENLFPDVRPALLHGDLWSGNYLISEKGKPYLIDPATYYGHYEVDLAMTRLFGGFGDSFYEAHSEHFPKIGGEAERNDLYQLYYLLVHLNLFGSSYKAAVITILNRYF